MDWIASLSTILALFQEAGCKIHDEKSSRRKMFVSNVSYLSFKTKLSMIYYPDILSINHIVQGDQMQTVTSNLPDRKNTIPI